MLEALGPPQTPCVCQIKGKQLQVHSPHLATPVSPSRYAWALPTQPAFHACDRNSAPGQRDEVPLEKKESMRLSWRLTVSEKPRSPHLMCKELPADSARCVLSYSPHQQQVILSACVLRIAHTGDITSNEMSNNGNGTGIEQTQHLVVV